MNERSIYKLFIAFVLAIFLTALFGCGRLVPIEPKAINETAVSASIKFPYKGLSPQSLTKIVVQVTHADIDTIRKELILSAGGAKGQLEVPTGKLLTFTAIAYQGTTAVLSGSTQVKPEAGKTATVQILLNFLVPALILTPPDTSLSLGSEVAIYLEARHCTDLGTIGARLLFDNTKLQVVDLGREDAFLKSNSGSINQLKFSKDNTNGSVDVVLGVFPASAAVSGDGKIVKIVFKTVATGMANLAVSLDNAADSDLGLFDKNANLMDALALGGSVEIK